MSLTKPVQAIERAGKNPPLVAPAAKPVSGNNGNGAPHANMGSGGLPVFDKVKNYTNANQVRALGLYPYFRTISSAQDTEVIMNGQKVLMLGSNSYLGLTNDPRIKEATIAATQKYGSGCAGSRALPIAANGCAAVGVYRPNAADGSDGPGTHHPFAIQVIESTEGKISGIHAFLYPELFAAFGLPSSLGA